MSVSPRWTGRVRTFAAAVAAAVLIGAGGAVTAAAAGAQTLYVSPGASNAADNSCANAGYPTISAAITAAAAGDTIVVCPGSYQEYVTIPSTLDNLTLKGQGPNPGPGVTGAPEILFPTTPNSTSLTEVSADSLVTVDGATGVDIEGLEISGPFYAAGCTPPGTFHYGVFVGGGGQADLQHDYVTDIQSLASEDLGGCQDGFGVGAGASFVSPPQSGALTLQNSTVDSYQKDGVFVDGTGSSAQIQNNTITGVGPSATIASNGVEVDDGAVGTIQNNTISANQYTIEDYQASGILLYNPGADVTVQNNKLTANDIGIYTYDPGTKFTEQNNQIAGDTTNGDSEDIQLDDVMGGTVQNNQVSGGQYGIDVFDGTNGVLLQNNQVKGVTDVGILNQGSTPETPSTTEPFVGQAESNTYQNDQASGSGTHDCQDSSTGSGTAGTANTWQNDQGANADPAGICKP